MDSENVFELFSQAVGKGDTVQLDEIINYFETANKINSISSTQRRHGESIPMDFITRPLNEQGETCLEVAAVNGHWDVLKVLLEQLKFHVYEQTDYKIPSLSFAFFRDIGNKIPIIKLLNYLVSIHNDDFIWLEFILDSIMTSSIARADKIITLELLGAFIIWIEFRPLPFPRTRPSNLYDSGLLKAIQYWKNAWILRDATEDGEPAVPNIPCALPERLRHAFGNNSKEMTLEELELFERQLKSNETTCGRPLQIQAFLISYRILSESSNPQGQTTFLMSFYYYRELSEYRYYCKRANQYGRAIEISLFSLETYCDDVSNVLSSYSHFHIFLSSLYFFDWSLYSSRGNDKPQPTSANFLIVTKSILKILANMHPQISSNKLGAWELKLDSQIWEIYQCLSKFLPKLHQEDHGKLINYFSDYIADFKLNRCLTTFLRLLTKNFKNESFSEVIPILQFLLDAGADPNETDQNGQAAIHILAKHVAVEKVPMILKALLNAGAHIDQATPNGETVFSILNQQQLEFHLPSFHPFDSVADDPLNVVLPLSCYCAQSIRRNKIPYEDRLPHKLQEFVSFH